MFQNLQFVTFKIINFQYLQFKKNNWLYEKIIDIFNWLKGWYGRKCVAEYIITKKEELRFQIDKLVKLWILRLFCGIRIAKKIKELKNTKVDINNLVLRDYDNKNYEHQVIATDVTYLLRTFDVK